MRIKIRYLVPKAIRFASDIICPLLYHHRNTLIDFSNNWGKLFSALWKLYASQQWFIILCIAKRREAVQKR